ncbi:MAG: Gfo/Idh/MocA family protein [Pseudolabrys sp.]
MIRVGIVGSNYGRTVLLPAFRADTRCAVVALAGSDLARTRGFADAAGVARAYGDWRGLVDDAGVDAVAIATRPDLQPAVALAAIALGKPVFAEKPMAGDLAGARAMFEAARDKGVAAAIDFNFHQIAAWQRAKAMLDGGDIGALRHVAVHWHIENRSIQQRMRNWKTLSDDGGGVLGNFISHCFHYLEWFGGPLAGLGAKLGGLPGDDTLQTTVTMALSFAGGAPASLSMSCASYLGPGHRLEFYGEDGTLVLNNIGVDYMRGFELLHARRPATAFVRAAIDDPADAQYPDGRIAPVSRLVKNFIDAIETKSAPRPGFAEGYRVQFLIDAAQRSHRDGHFLDVRPEIMERA